MTRAISHFLSMTLATVAKVIACRSVKICAVVSTMLLCLPWFAAAQDMPDVQRFTYSGDGRISLNSEKNSHSFAGFYRTGRGKYDQAARQAIERVFDAVPGGSAGSVSLRLIEYLDYIQDQLNPDGRITIISGFRAPEYNAALRRQGRLAATASLHQYGMAADVKINAVPARRLWDFVKARNFGGAGYYHGASVHIDVGPARSWDETNSGVGSGISDDNKLIGLITNFDAYLPGEAVFLRYIRMTAFPIGIQPRMILEDTQNTDRPVHTIALSAYSDPSAGTDCHQFLNIADMNDITWHLPQDLPPGSYRIRSIFCGPNYPEMPVGITTPPFTVIGLP